MDVCRRLRCEPLPFLTVACKRANTRLTICLEETGRVCINMPGNADSSATGENRLTMNKIDFAVGIGGENGQGIASTGNILALIFARRGLHLNAYNAYQSIIRGGHTFLTIRASDGPVRSMGDKIDLFIPLNQDTMDRHLRLLKSGACAIYDRDKVTPGEAAEGVQLCAMPMKELTKGNKLAVNTAALGAALQLLGIESEPLETVIRRQFKKKGDAVVAENVAIARAGYEYAAQNFALFPGRHRAAPSR